MRFSLTGGAGVGIRLFCACLAALVATTAFAEGKVLSMVEAGERTLAGNPDLHAFGFQIEAQHARLQQSDYSPPPELGLLVENTLGSGIYDGTDATESTLNLAWIFERGKREHRVAAAQAGVNVLETQADIRRLDAVAETSRLFVDALAWQSRLALGREAVERGERTISAIRQRVTAGSSPRADLSRAEAQLSRTELALEDITHELATVRHRLAAQWGAVAPDFELVSGDLKQLPIPADFSVLLGRIERNPNLAKYLTQQRLREAELRLAEAQARPDWRLSAGVRRFELSDDHAFVAGITIPLSSKTLNRGRIAEARAKLARVEAEQNATRVEVQTQLFALYQALLHSLHRAETLREKVLPRVQKALSETRTAYGKGRYSYFELQVLQAELWDTRTALVDAASDAHSQLIEIERLTGMAMPASVQQPRGRP